MREPRTGLTYFWTLSITCNRCIPDIVHDEKGINIR